MLIETQHPRPTTLYRDQGQHDFSSWSHFWEKKKKHLEIRKQEKMMCNSYFEWGSEES